MILKVKKLKLEEKEDKVFSNDDFVFALVRTFGHKKESKYRLVRFPNPIASRQLVNLTKYHQSFNTDIMHLESV